MRALSIGVLAAFVMAACGGTAAPPAGTTAPSAAPATQAAATAKTAAPEPAVTIQFWHGQSGVLGERLQALIDKFNSTHKIQVKATFQGNYDQLYQKVVSGLQAGSVPDLAQVTGPPQAAQYWKAKALTPVQQFVDGPDGFSAEQLKDFVPALLNDSSLPVNGKPTLVSWPLSKSLALLYYNPDILQKAGVSVPKTWDELRSTLKTVKEKTGVQPLAWTPDVYYFFLPLLWSSGGEVLSPDLSKAAFNDDKGLAALQYMYDLVIADKTGQVTTGFDWQNPFAQGKVAFAVSTSVSRPYIEQAMPKGQEFKVGMAPLPAGPKGSATDLFGNNLVIFNKGDADHQRAAWLFMKWMTEVDQTVAWSLASGYMPLRVSARQAAAFKEKADADPRYLVALNALKDAHGIPGSPDWQKVQTIMGEMVTKVVTGKAQPKAALDEATKKVNDALGGY